ncbi:class I SAM-dependent methyltransferase [Nocardioides zeae]|uniref:Methyltransferase domain-containing protein n=1 Tax=Nocardioides zeae TaxID=1457234 RepID=A0A6P0HIB5_9ACTN|nr:class I SAM-dependent methyltransferase [Nocardioides zeae]NEN78408.1 methyltransferase domain-containing protein [Nocardioides zeae]
MVTRWEQVARSQAGEDYAAAYAARFRQQADAGNDVHGEATLVTALAPPPSRVLDAGCGTGRVAVRLHELGHPVVGVDVDASMVEVARRDAPHLEWHVADLATLDLGERFDVVVVAGNVLPLLEPGTLTATAAALAAHVAPEGLLVAGFGLDAAHLPVGCPPTPLADVEAAFAEAGMAPPERWAAWDRAPYDGGGYVVGVWAPR